MPGCHHLGHMALQKLSLAALVALFLATGLGARSTTATATTSAALQVPTERQGRHGYPLLPMPAVFDTYQPKARVCVVAQGLDRPWNLTMLADGDLLVSRRFPNEIRFIRKGALDAKPLAGLPPIRRLFDVVTHPRFADNKWLYSSYSKPDDARKRMVLAPARYDGASISGVQDLYTSEPVTQVGSRVAFAPDGTIYITLSGAGGRVAASAAGPSRDSIARAQQQQPDCPLLLGQSTVGLPRGRAIYVLMRCGP